jgi:hypothetical protein
MALYQEFYTGQRRDWHSLYPHVGEPRAQQAILFAIEHQGVSPPRAVLERLWDAQGLQRPYTFFVPAVFKHHELWTRIIHDLVRAGQWQALTSYKATRPDAQQGHMDCAHLYLHDCHATRLAAVYASTTTLLQHADALLKRNDVDHLLLRMVSFPEFAQAVERSNTTSTVALLVRPVQELTDDEFTLMKLTYMDRLGPCLHWHTDALRRGLFISPSRWHVAPTPVTPHELLHFVARQGTVPAGPHLWAKTLREYPAACASLGQQLVVALQRHTRDMQLRVQLAGKWPLPAELLRAIARFV